MAIKIQLKPKKLGEFTYDRWLVPLLKPARYIYIIAVEKPIWYKREKSRIVYIGMTKKASHEILSSMGYHVIHTIPKKLRMMRFGNGVSVHFIDLKKDIQPKDIEDALIYAFRARYGAIPKCNIHGTGYTHKRAITVKEKYNITLDELTDVFTKIDKMK